MFVLFFQCTWLYLRRCFLQFTKLGQNAKAVCEILVFEPPLAAVMHRLLLSGKAFHLG